MTEELDLLSSVAGKGSEGKKSRAKFEASIIATFNAYLPFYEDVVLRRLVSSGCQHNILLVDRNILLQNLSSHTARPRLAGRAYTLVPMHAAGAFHPKVALLVGKKSARVFVGSHNVTLSGFGHNREITTQFDLPNGAEDSNAPLAQWVWNYLETWLQHQADRIPGSIMDAARRVATNFAPWLEAQAVEAGNVRFVGSNPEGGSLWERVRPLLPKKARQVIVSGPFFDRAGAFLETLARDLQAPELVVGVEPDTVELCRQENLPNSVRFVDATTLGRGMGYLHAKVLWIEGEADGAALITGSANPSSSAWTEVPSKRNAEAVLVHLGDEARTLATTLNILSLPSMPDLAIDVLQAIGERNAQTERDQHTSSSATIVAAEALEREILVHSPGLTLKQVKVIRCFDHGLGSLKNPQSTHCTNIGLHIGMAPEDVARTGSLEIELVDGHFLRAIVHHPSLIARLSRTTTQRRFREALDSLGSDSPDLPTVIRLASNLIFDGEELPLGSGSKALIKKGKDEEGKGGEPPLSLAVSIEETKKHRKQARELRGGDLAYIIDTLIYRLGVGLRTATEQLEESGPSEEEQIGTEDDFKPLPEEPPRVDLVKVCTGKVRTLVGRMLKHFEKASKNPELAHRPIEQLIAVLAILREVRAHDRRLSHLTKGQSLVPQDQRRRLLYGSLAALFGRKQRLFKVASRVFQSDPENDLSRLLGLLLWLAWDSGLDARTTDINNEWDSDQRREHLLGLARLLEISVVAGKDKEVFAELEHSIWRTVQDTARGGPSAWIEYHRAWSKALADLPTSSDAWKRGGMPKIGSLGIALKEVPLKLRLVIGLESKYVRLAEIGEPKNEVKFLNSYIAVVEMPKVSI